MVRRAVLKTNEPLTVPGSPRTSHTILAMDGSNSSDETRWERKAKAASASQVVGVHSYRAHFNQRGRSVLSDTSSWDCRRSACFAPFVASPAMFIISKRVPVAVRPAYWVGTLLLFGVGSTVMYNTDASTESDYGPPTVIVRASSSSAEGATSKR